jgi:hypothetical protein
MIKTKSLPGGGGENTKSERARMFFIYDVAKKREEMARRLFTHDMVKIKRKIVRYSLRVM